VDHIARHFLAHGQIVFLVWVTFDKRKWSILAKRRRSGVMRVHRRPYFLDPAFAKCADPDPYEYGATQKDGGLKGLFGS
jgi:hypothetical protein